MGRFGLSFSDEKSAGFRIDRRKHYATVTRQAEKGRDGPFQRCLAWCSYFVLVFVAICTFNSPAIAAVAKTAVQPVIIVNDAIERKADAFNTRGGDPWVLRGTR